MVVNHDFLEEVVQKELGFSSLDDFARQQAYSIFQQKLTECKAIIGRYEAKYGMDFLTFEQRVVNHQDEALKPFGIIEKEDDLMDWRFEQHSLPYFQQRLEQLAR
ncbi:hypothetical protein ACS5NO_29595 [Larkinella sp. GY13]|uniref:hypothetical protein n=1 Tax=Larkinella sp. GY13 TaxID=3453720 RepID=UPI003EE9FB3A